MILGRDSPTLNLFLSFRCAVSFLLPPCLCLGFIGFDGIATRTTTSLRVFRFIRNHKYKLVQYKNAN